jgi:tetratricopeptide (TPR) repeat protein
VLAYERGQIYLKEGKRDNAISDFGLAIKYFEQASGSEYDNVIVTSYYHRGRAWEEKGNLERALADLDQAIGLWQKHRLAMGAQYADYHGARAELRIKKGDLLGAISDLGIAISNSTSDVQLIYYSKRGKAHERMGNINAAIEDYRAALKLFGAAPESWRTYSGSIEAQREATARLAALGAAPKLAAPKTEPPPPSVAPSAPPTVLAKPPPELGRRVALVIGNSAYQAVAGLANPQRDADAVSAALKKLGFQTVRVKANLTRERLIAALRSFEAEAEKADWALIYYSGHGIEVGGVNYLVPVDARLRADKDVQDEAVPLDRVLSAVEATRKLRVVILDACRENPFLSQMRRTGASRTVGRGLSRVEPDVGTLIVYAAKHGEIALDGDGALSPFATALISRIDTAGLEIRRLFDLVRDDVVAATGRRQMPFTYGSVPGGEEFFFLPK